MRLAVLAIAACLIAACSPTAPEPVATPAASPTETASPSPETPMPSPPAPRERAATEQACKAGGGDWIPVCLQGNPACVTKAADAGKACTDGSQCASGACLVEEFAAQADKPATGKCAVDDNPCGCKQFVVNGVAQHALCAD